MNNEKYLLSRNDIAIRTEIGNIKDELSQLNSWLQWFNSLAYVQPITTLQDAKDFLSNTKVYHERHVKAFLKTKCNGELPPNTKMLCEAWNIADCENKDFSDCVSWQYLQFIDGRLCVPESVFQNIKERYCTRATTKQEKALVDRIYKFADELQYFTPKKKDEVLTDSGVFDYTSHGLKLNVVKFYSLLK